MVLTAMTSHSLTAKRSASKEISQKDVPHESFGFTTSDCSFGKSRKKLRFQVFNSQFLREVLHESFVVTSSTFTFEGYPARKLRFHVFKF